MGEENMGQLCYRLVARQDWISRSRLHTDMVPLYQSDISRWKRDISKRCPSKFKTKIFWLPDDQTLCAQPFVYTYPNFFLTEEHNTSGVQIYAKTKEALAEFRHQRQEGKVLVDSWHSGYDSVGRSSSNNDDDLQYEMVVYVKCCHTGWWFKHPAANPLLICG